MKAPLLIVANPGEVNEDEGLDGPNTKAWALRVAPDLMRQVAAGMADAPTPEVFFPSFVVDEPHRARLSALLCETVASFDEPGSQLERESRLLGLLTDIITRCAEAPPTRRSVGRERQATKLVKGYLQEHYGTDITLSDLAALTGLNKSYLLEVFKRDVGLSPHEYLTCTRVARAKHLLRQGLPIAQVALATGFCDQSHLNRLFKRYVLVTPGRFQQASLS